jgi:hypothetical protein
MGYIYSMQVALSLDGSVSGTTAGRCGQPIPGWRPLKGDCDKQLSRPHDNQIVH